MKLLCIFTVLFLAVGLTAFGDSVLTLKGGYIRPTSGNDLLDLNSRPTTLDRDRLDGLFGEVGYFGSIAERINIGGNVGYYNSDTELDELEFDLGDGETARRNVELRIIPIEFAVHFLPAGRNVAISPYVGGGVGAYVWKYREQGLFFVDPNNPNAGFRQGIATSDNTDFGWHVEGGVSFPISHAVSILGEAKYFQVRGDLGGPDSELDDLFTDDRPRLDLDQLSFTGGVAFSF